MYREWKRLNWYKRQYQRPRSKKIKVLVRTILRRLTVESDVVE